MGALDYLSNFCTVTSTRTKQKAIDKSENGLRWLRKKSEKCSEFNKRSEIYGGEQKGEQGGSERICGSKEGAEEGKKNS
ncbi:hypothetical protein JHK82_034074 [Glycine max]|nr:hypothetical protein JHK87_034002 [Glycine soja]KAG4980823.1 hypothetical protein JHK85_034781 [Glycine max]KAG4986453.1 hypothetical protein JHK86_034144 [Glycine max]KAG5119653.1 hypothetical protein JHK82_034073 [Glycine max]KAG5119654.1 hypothetical protein JHK82_034074 [Glycine max]